jgi:hypothetical protein
LNNNNFIGDIPPIFDSYSYNQVQIDLSNNYFTGYTQMAGGSHYCQNINYSNNYLPADEVNKVLSDAVKAVNNYGTLDLSGDNMGLPYGQGSIDIQTLNGMNWTVTVNVIKIGTGGFNGTTYMTDMDTNNKIYVAGSYYSFSGSTQNKLIRLNSGGTKDTSFDIGTGFDYQGSPLYCVKVGSA